MFSCFSLVWNSHIHYSNARCGCMLCSHWYGILWVQTICQQSWQSRITMDNMLLKRTTHSCARWINVEDGSSMSCIFLNIITLNIKKPVLGIDIPYSFLYNGLVWTGLSLSSPWQWPSWAYAFLCAPDMLSDEPNKQKNMAAPPLPQGFSHVWTSPLRNPCKTPSWPGKLSRDGGFLLRFKG